MYNYVIKLENGANEWELFAGSTNIDDATVDGRAIDGASFDQILDIDVVLDGVNRVKFPEGGQRFYTVDSSGFLRMCHVCNGPVISQFMSTG